jgi:hypothetical protein
METVIQKTFSQYTPWLVRLASHIEAVGPAAVPLCRGVEEHCVVMARHGVLKHSPVWKHFHIQATTWPVAVITRKVKIKPGAHPLDVQHVSDLEAIIDEWGGGIFKSAVRLPPHDSRAHRHEHILTDMVVRNDHPTASAPPVFVVMIKNPLAWLASMQSAGMAEFILRTEFNVSPQAVDTATQFPPPRSKEKHPAATAGPYGSVSRCKGRQHSPGSL